MKKLYITMKLAQRAAAEIMAEETERLKKVMTEEKTSKRPRKINSRTVM